MNEEHLSENLKDAKVIIQSVLNQPLYIQDVTGSLTLLQAAQEYRPQDAQFSDLRKIVYSFIDYPEHTEALLTELELLCQDLEEE